MTRKLPKSKAVSRKPQGIAGKKKSEKAKLANPPATVLQPDETEVASEEQALPEEPTDLTPQMVGIFCDGIESVHRNWLVAQGPPEDYMPSWKDINEQNPRLPYDEDAPKTIEELFASLKLTEAPSKAKRAPGPRARKRA
jgi:hypothetical protein